MSENLGRKIKFISVAIGILASVACFASAVGYFGQGGYYVFYACVWVIFAILSLLMIIPLYTVGNMADELAAENRKLRAVADKMARIEQRGTTSSSLSVDKYSPASRSKTNLPRMRTTSPQPSGSTMGVDTIERRVSAAAEDLTRDFSSAGTVELEKRGMGTVTEAFTPSPDVRIPTGETGRAAGTPGETRRRATNESMNAFYTTSSIDTFKVSRKSGSVTRFITATPAVSIAAGGLHSVAITETGRVVSTGYGTYGQCNVSDWTDIAAVAAGNHHTLALKRNGTCVATGYSGYGQCNVSDWTGICSIAAGVGHSVGLRDNGTCVATGDNTYGQCNVLDWIDIIAISAGYNYTVGLKADGTIIAVGANTDGQWGAIKWGSIVSVAAGGLHTIGLRGDGTCVAVGNNANDQCEVAAWKNIHAVAAGNYHTVGLTSDGKVIATGYNGYGQCNVSGWTNIVAVAAGRNHTLGLTKGGVLLATGDDTYGQCNTHSFPRIRI